MQSYPKIRSTAQKFYSLYYYLIAIHLENAYFGIKTASTARSLYADARPSALCYISAPLKVQL